jgi:hypothetical protein
VIVNEKTGTIADLWDGCDLKCNFRRTVGARLYRQWLEVVQLASTLEITDEEDAMIWQFTSTGIYSFQSLYKVITFRGVVPVYVPSVWNLKAPQEFISFSGCCLKTRDNPAKRQKVEVPFCLFYNENETSQHLFFDCVVVRKMWSMIPQAMGLEIGTSFESISAKWLSSKKFSAVNIISFAALWGIRKLRNEFCFQHIEWRSMEVLMMRVIRLAQNWLILCSVNKKEELVNYLTDLTVLARRPEMMLGRWWT